jgi:AcrR family transcriptional regulator
MGIRERQDRERQAVHLAILDAARDLFVDEGYRNVSIRKIAERIEYSPAAIYSYFASRDDIFLALAEEGFHRLDEKVRAAGADTTTAVDLVRARWWAFYEFSQEQPAYFELMFVDRSVPRITQQWDGFELLQRMLSEAVSTIQRAIDEGGFPTTVNPNAAMHMLWACLIGPAVIGIRHRLASGEDYDALARDVLDATIAGLKAGITTSFVSCKCPEEGIAGAPDPDRADFARLGGSSVPAGVRRHES